MVRRKRRRKRKRYIKSVAVASIVVILIVIASIALMPKKTEEYYLDRYRELVNAEMQDLQENYSFGTFGNLRYALGYIDNDNIPELLLSDGNGHIDGVFIFSLKGKKELVKTGKYSSFGSVAYVPKKDRIISQYGSMGWYHQVFSTFKSPKVEEVLLSCNNLEEKYYKSVKTIEEFKGYDIPGKDMLNGVFLDPKDNAKEISKEEYDKLYSKFAKGSVRVDYDEMDEWS